MTSNPQTNYLEQIGEYKYGFSDPDVSVFNTGRGLDREVVKQISSMKSEPQWMLDFRLKALEHFQQRPMPTWGADLSKLDLDNIFYYVKPTDKEICLRDWRNDMSMYGLGILRGLGVTLKHFFMTYVEDIKWRGKRYYTAEGIAHRTSKDADGIFTVQYPEEKLPVPAPGPNRR